MTWDPGPIIVSDAEKQKRRDEFAMAALTAIVGTLKYYEIDHGIDDRASLAYRYADAMERARFGSIKPVDIPKEPVDTPDA